MLAVFGSDAGLLQASCQDPEGSLMVTRTATPIVVTGCSIYSI